MERKELEERYLSLGNQLPSRYPNLQLKNHCYWRIALDNAVNNKWDRVLDRPAYKNLSKYQLQAAVELLETYQKDQETLQQHNTKSLEYRQKLS